VTSSTAGHTAGPWRLQILGQQEADLINRGTFMGLSGGSGAPTTLDAADAEEWEANARLIAAAPELLAALEKAEELYHLGIINAPDGLFDEVQSLRRAAIAKATGAA
jgi:hypothetical protein